MSKEYTKDDLLLCAGGCGHWTKPRKMDPDLAEALLPDAKKVLSRESAGKCAPCYRGTRSTAQAKLKESNVEAAYRANAAFLAQRQARLGKRTPVHARMELVSRRMMVRG